MATHLFSRNPFWRRLGLPALLAIGGAALLVACAEAPPLPQRPAAPSSAIGFDAAIDFAVDDLLVQVQRLKEFQPPKLSVVDAALRRDVPTAPRSKIVVDVALDSVSGQQTQATRFLDGRLLARAKEKFPQYDLVPLIDSIQAANGATSASFLLATSMTRLTAQNVTTDIRYRINLSITDLRTGLVLAQAATQTTASGVDVTPTRFYQDSPSIKRDKMAEGQIKTSQAEVGAAADGTYVAGLTTSALLSEGGRLYDAGKADAALRMYEVALARPDGKQLRTYNGLYLTHMQLAHPDAAERAFAQIVSLGLDANSLSIKFLFKPGSADFLSDQGISNPYPMWLRTLSSEIGKARKCISIIGHSSHTGTEQFNDRLSLQRATSLQRKLESNAPAIASYLLSSGMGYKENIIGTGADDLSDAMDRRVEFRTRECAASSSK